MNVKQAYRKALDTQETPSGSPVNLHRMAASIFHNIPYHAVTSRVLPIVAYHNPGGKEMLVGTKKALEASIQKWQDILDKKAGDRASSNCALCLRFTENCARYKPGTSSSRISPDPTVTYYGNKYDQPLEVCPVALNAGTTSCKRTHYYGFYGSYDPDKLGRWAVTKDDVAAARAMRDYLKGLLLSNINSKKPLL